MSTMTVTPTFGKSLEQTGSMCTTTTLTAREITPSLFTGPPVLRHSMNVLEDSDRIPADWKTKRGFSLLPYAHADVVANCMLMTSSHSNRIRLVCVWRD